MFLLCSGSTFYLYVSFVLLIHHFICLRLIFIENATIIFIRNCTLYYVQGNWRMMKKEDGNHKAMKKKEKGGSLILRVTNISFYSG